MRRLAILAVMAAALTALPAQADPPPYTRHDARSLELPSRTGTAEAHATADPETGELSASAEVTDSFPISGPFNFGNSTAGGFASVGRATPLEGPGTYVATAVFDDFHIQLEEASSGLPLTGSLARVITYFRVGFCTEETECPAGDTAIAVFEQSAAPHDRTMTVELEIGEGAGTIYLDAQLFVEAHQGGEGKALAKASTTISDLSVIQAG